MVQLVKQVQSAGTNSAPVTNGTAPSIWSQVDWNLIIGVAFLGICVLIVFALVFWLATWIYKKIKDARRKGQDIEFFKYTIDLRMCNINRDSKYSYRVWYKFFLGFKRAKIYAKTSLGRKFVGYYLGEATKKEGFLLIGIRQKWGIFAYEDDVVIFPYDIGVQTIKKNDDFSLDLMCEGIDEVISSEYYSVPVFENKATKDGKNEKFIDFSNLVMEKYLKDYVYRDVIKTTITEFREGVKDATEQNPFVQLKRKTAGNLKEDN